MVESTSDMHVEEGTAKHRVWATSSPMGDDIVVRIGGGEVPHVGAVGMAVTRPSLGDPSTLSSSTSLLTVVGHKEEYLAMEAASSIANATGRTTVAVVGIHVDQASAEDIKILVSNARTCTSRLAALIGRRSER